MYARNQQRIRSVLIFIGKYQIQMKPALEFLNEKK